MNFKILAFAFLWVAQFAFSADVISSSRLYPWEPGVNVGVPGGIPARANYQTLLNMVVDFGADNTGATDIATAFGNAIDAANAVASSSNRVVIYFPAGTYRLNAGRGWSNYITVRGAGVGTSTIKYYGATGSALGIQGSQSGDFSWPNSGISNDPVAGQTELRVSTVAHLGSRVGSLINIQVRADTDTPRMSVKGFQYFREFTTRITSLSPVGGNPTITVYPPIPFDMPTAIDPRYQVPSQTYLTEAQANFCGLEDITVDGVNSSTTSGIVQINNAYACWMDNVEVKNAPNYIFSTSYITQCEVRHSYLHTRTGVAGSNGGGWLGGRSCFTLFEDNIVDDIFPGIELNFGCTGNAISNNYLHEVYVLDLMGGAININHGPHNSYNLVEGNIAQTYQSDGLFGSASENTINGNWFHATSTNPAVTSGRFALRDNRFNRNNNYTGNILGRTGVGVTFSYMNGGPGFDTSSTTPNTITGTGGYTFTVGTGLDIEATVSSRSLFLIYSASAPSNWITGYANSYDSGTGVLSVNANRVEGSGSHSDWVVLSCNGYGTPICYALGGPNIGNGGSNGDKVMGASTLGMWWRCWDGTPMEAYTGELQPTTFSSGRAYFKGMCVLYTAEGRSDWVGSGTNCTAWMAINAAKNGLTTWATPGPAQNDWAAISENSFQEFDASVRLTAVLKDNYNAATASIRSTEALTGGETRKPSYLRTTKPPFFGDIAWPPPNSQNVPSDQTTSDAFAQNLPAAWRFFYGNENYLNPSSGTWTVGTLNVGTINKIP